jgi:hypothetical protein
MNADQWESIKHFHAGENWGNWQKMDFQFLRTLDTVRHLSDTPFELTSPAWTPGGGHSAKSFHYIGRAADFRLPRKSMWESYDLLVQTLEDMGIYRKVGFGFYPGGKFFHLDDRDCYPGFNAKPAAVWVRPKESEPKVYIYGQDALAYIASIRPEQITNQG